MQILIHDTNELSELDIQVLKALVGDDNTAAPAPAPAAKKAAPAKKTAAPAKSTKAEDPDPDPEPGDDDAGDDDSGEVDLEALRESVVEAATKLVSNGGSPQVKAALGKVGAKKVSEISDDDLQTFLDEIS